MSTTDDERKTGTGAEGDASADTKTPFSPRPDDDSPLGDTDQHSKADHSEDPAKAIRPTNAAAD